MSSLFVLLIAVLCVSVGAAPKRGRHNEEKAFQEMFQNHPLLRSLKLFAVQTPAKEPTESKPRDKVHIVTYPVYQQPPHSQHPGHHNYYYPAPPHSYGQPTYSHPHHPQQPQHPQMPPLQIPPSLWSQLVNSGYPIIIINTTSIGNNIVEQAAGGTTRDALSLNDFNAAPLVDKTPEGTQDGETIYIASSEGGIPEDLEYDDDIEPIDVSTERATKLVGHSKNPLLEAILARERRRKRVQERVAAAFILRNFSSQRK